LAARWRGVAGEWGERSEQMRGREGSREGLGGFILTVVSVYGAPSMVTIGRRGRLCGAAR
jgi:hypothetical protein